MSIRLQWKRHWFLFEMVTHFTMRTYGVNQAFQFVNGIWIHRNSRQIRFLLKRPVLLYIRATSSELPYHTRTMNILAWPMVLIKARSLEHIPHV